MRNKIIEYGKYFSKRTFTFRTFYKANKVIMQNRKIVRRAMRSEKISEAFRERIMLVVTAVNGCRYCAWGHTDWAKKAGCNEEEIKELMKFNFNISSEEESLALMFAQHFTETEENPQKEALEQLIDFYGEEEAENILIIIRMISIGNLLGNTFDAFLSRFIGKPPEKGSIIFEFFVFLFSFPFLIPYRIKKDREERKKKRRKNNENRK
ncbi:MAG: carboxymuconolactone decarboxylase family protein [Candidatus Heimdallarchaeum endolithica]|uniref:Carboxymuconolactone decarboxylase family protein n=1 Tax=Candidatus Heimdallarchaeum endolithica TaxID=2876572 RepID=A0A9Y1BSI8_9ARCH|nr:MAG: carboxymuconolactone decarboxylase family protein [Candidatus Heimdallarchaeum endolithica]